MAFAVGSLVRFREREWIVLPSDDKDLVRLQPLQGSPGEVTGAFLPLEGDAIEPAQFALPDPKTAREYGAVRLLRDAARLSIRNSAGPFRALGQIAVRPRPYQYVPLLMALRMDPVRLLIADDVGVGKTVEAGLIAKELLARGEAKGLLVLCPPVLCEQWQRELDMKFGIQAVVLRTSTYAQLTRDLPVNMTVYQAYPYIVASIDFVKSQRYRDALLEHAPDLVIVDEAHSVARPPSGSGRDRQQRHELVRELAKEPRRHLILLTATPHSGIRESFASLFGLLKPELEAIALKDPLSPEDRKRLARHFVQRQRKDVEAWLGNEKPFPERKPLPFDKTAYNLHPDYRRLFEQVLEFTRERVRRGDAPGYRQRVRYWGALALLRSVMSSPAAAVRALERRLERLDAASGQGEELPADALDAVREPEVYDLDETVIDAVPQDAVAELMAAETEAERGQLRRFRVLANKLKGPQDTKLGKAQAILMRWLEEGHSPIVYCRFVDTAEYVAAELKRALENRFDGLRVGLVTGLQADEEREARIRDLMEAPVRLLVATDCMSEGVDLQYAFNAVLHYDLPWNPNRLEQREGRVDRFGQPKPVVPTAVLWGQDNPVDAAVLEVLIRKAKEIYDRLQITVPVPMDSAAVMDALVQALFEQRASAADPAQMQLPIALTDFQRDWEAAAEREQRSRSIFAQLSLQRKDIIRDLEAAEEATGTPEDIRQFVIRACQTLGIPIEVRGHSVRIDREILDPWGAVRPHRGNGKVRVVFDGPAPEGAVLLHRLHPLVDGLAQQVLGEALRPGGSDKVPRCGAFRTEAVPIRTALCVLRVRYCLRPVRSRQPDQFAEEIVLGGFRNRPDGLSVEWFGLQDAALQPLLEAQPDENLTPRERIQHVEWALSVIEQEQAVLEQMVAARARAIEEVHRRLREALDQGQVVVTAYPPDVLGLVVLVPVPRGWAR
ncbi:MAG TPA: helicase-related protein [Thermaerobacter sp.]